MNAYNGNIVKTCTTASFLAEEIHATVKENRENGFNAALVDLQMVISAEEDEKKTSSFSRSCRNRRGR